MPNNRDSSHPEALAQRIVQLELEIKERDKDIQRYRSELLSVNAQLESMIGQLRNDLKMAHAIQRALVPTDLPNIPGFDFSTKYIPSAYRGGDYFDIFEHDDRFRFGMIIANSSGFAMSALLMSVLLRLTRQMEARKGTDPTKVLKQIVTDMEPSMEAGDSANIFYGMLDRRNFELSYSRLGTIVALHQSFPSGTLQVLETSGGAIAKGAKTVPKAKFLSLNPRDRLIFCTPGIIEAKSLAGEEFGQERLLRTIAAAPKQGAHELRNHILFEVQTFSGGQEPMADRTVVIAEVKDRVIKLAKP